MGQTASVKGVVTDEVTGEFLPFVSVVVKGRPPAPPPISRGCLNSAVSPPGVVNLSFSSVGYKTANRLGD